MKLLVGVVGALVLCTGLEADAGADTSSESARPRAIALESFTAKRPDDAEHWLSVVLEELARHGIASGTDVGRLYEQRVSQPAQTPDGVPDDFAKQVEQAHQLLVHAKYADASAIVSPLVDAARANPAIIAQHQGLRDSVRRAMITLALAKLGLAKQAAHDSGSPIDRSGAVDVMTELVRSFPDTVVSRAQDGPDAIDLYNDAIKRLDKDGHGTLIVNIGDNNAVVFLDERFERQGDFVKPDLRPGNYRLFVQRGKTEGRLYVVTITPNAETTVNIDLDFDSTLHTSPLWTGAIFPDDKTREQFEAEYSARFAQTIDARTAVVVGIGTEAGHLAVIGVIVDVNSGREVDRRSVSLDPDPSVERLRDLGRFLAGVASDGSHGEMQHEEHVTARARGRGWTLWGGWPWITGSVAIGAFATGGYLIHIDGQQTCGLPPCQYLYRTKVRGYATLGVGAALTVATGYLFYRLHRNHHGTELSIAPVDEGSGYVIQIGGGF